MKAHRKLIAAAAFMILPGAALAQNDVVNESGLVPPWRVNAQDLRPETCQEPRCDRARENTRQV